MSGFFVGAVAGQNYGSISGSYATGALASDGLQNFGGVGGLVGANYGVIADSYATVDVSGGYANGGLVGVWVANGGGAVGHGGAVLANSYANGKVSGTRAGGLIGMDSAAQVGPLNVVSSYWDVARTGQALGCGLIADAGGCAGPVGLSLAQMTQASSYAGWSMDEAGGQATTWRIYDGQTTPLLKRFLQTINVAVVDATKTYNADNQILSVTTVGANASKLFGVAAFSGSGRNVGTYSLNYANGSGGFYSNQQGYDLVASGRPGTLTITPAALTISAVEDSKVYDGTAISAGVPFVAGLLGGDSASGLGQSFDSVNAGARTINVNAGYTIADGNGGGNYVVTLLSAMGSITPAPIKLTGNLSLSAVSDTKVYDGTTRSNAAVLVSGLVGSDSVTNLTQSFDSPNVGARILSVDPGYQVNDGNGGGNYTVTTATASGTITPATLTLSAVGDSRIYDATRLSSGVVAVSGLIGPDSVSGLGQSFDSANAGARTLSVNGGFSVLDGNGGANYSVVTNTASGTITPATLTLSAVGDSRIYDATRLSSGVVAVSGLIGSDSVSGLGQSFDSANAGARTLSVNGGFSVLDGNGGANYSVVTNTASGTITPAALTITYAANAASSVYGNAISGLSGSASALGLVGADSLASVTSGTASFATSATSASGVGSYGITGSGLVAASGNYAMTFAQAPGNATALSITARPITVTADAQSRGVGSNNPALTYTLGGSSPALVNGDTLGGALATTATPTAIPGAYAITQGTLSAGQNYTLTYVGNQMTVIPDPTPLTVVVTTIAPNLAQQITPVVEVAKQQQTEAVNNASPPQVLISTTVNDNSMTSAKPVDESVSASGDSSQWHKSVGAGQ